MRVGIVYGGNSSEAKASEKNAKAIAEVLLAKGYDVIMLEYGQNMIQTLRESGIDIVYLCVQGKHHGDGTLQAMLDHEQIPYTGSRTQAAMLINDKILCKLLFDRYGIPTPKWAILSGEEYRTGFDYGKIGFPFVAKAPTQGGSFGIELIHTPEELHKIKNVFEYDDPILLEEYIDGGFYTVGLYEKDNRLITLKCAEGVEMVSGAKAETDITLFTGEYGIETPDLPDSVLRETERLAQQVFKVTGAGGYARVDFMIPRKTGRPTVLEINAVPGLKRESLMPRQAEYSGVRYEDMVEDILLSAWQEVTGGKGNA
ncbi:MAG: hypothetical protein J1F60_09950 [Oscillospiraceae bacterium]|nr:hypothetical protein [Oscillospiraceae bacterium]